VIEEKTFPDSTTKYIEVPCRGRGCKRMSKVDEHHPKYAEIRAQGSIPSCSRCMDYTVFPPKRRRL
jgi:hypothetical protein